ncbi:hypothetical protein [Massilia sp. TWP1-3-3]|uniref:hypothetical protein n=1 Tax=Massilia sp. TWP1-3-3 TaxID=2804573 RepID=UPI003CFA79AC
MTFEAYAYFRTQGKLLAGAPGDLHQRVRLYQDLYQDSGKRNVFPLIAAHGTLWASGFFRKGALGGWLLSLAYLLEPSTRRAKLRSLAAFADTFRDINRRVCAEAYALYHYTKRYGGTPFIRRVIGNDFADILCECHLANQFDVAFTQAQREKLFTAFIAWEQETIVARAVTEAFHALDWPAVASLALRPRVNFAYFKHAFHMQFENFASQDERIRQGLRAYRWAEEVELERVEALARPTLFAALGQRFQYALCW